MKRSWSVTLLMAAMLACLAFVACGGGDDDDVEDPTATEEATDDASSEDDDPTGTGTNTTADLSLLRDIVLEPADVGEGVEVEQDDKTYTPADGGYYTYWFQGTFEGTSYSSYSSGPSDMTAGLSRDYTSSPELALEDLRLHVASFEDDGTAATFFNDFAENIVDARCESQAGDSGTISGATDSDVCDYLPNEREERILAIIREGRFVAILTLLGDPNDGHVDLANDVLNQVADNMKDAS